MASLLINGREFLVTANDDEVFGWGSYPMAPYAGRVRRGRFEFDGQAHELPVTMGPHAIHGMAFIRAWTPTATPETSQLSIGTDFGPEWPLGGRVEQHAEIENGQLRLTMQVFADQSMPVVIGWHPWFKRVIDGSTADLEADLTQMWELDDEAIPTGGMVTPPPGPWDNCFLVASDPAITWPGVQRLRLSSSHAPWVIYDEQDHAFCVEPQSDAPDAFNREPQIIEAGDSLTMTFTIAWEEA